MQIKLQVALITPLIHVKGYAAPETKTAVEQARLLLEQADALGETPEDPLQLFTVLFGLTAASIVAFNGDVSRDLAAHFLVLAEKQKASFPLVLAHNLLGASSLYRGDFAEARAHLGQGFALYDPAEHRPLATRFGQDVKVVILCWRALALWLLGRPMAALADAEQALNSARKIGQAGTLMYALNNASFTLTFCGRYAAAKALLDEVLPLAEEKGTSYWKAFGIMGRGSLMALTGNASNAARLIASGIALFRSTGATLFVPLHLSYLARAYAALGQLDDAWRCIGEAMTAAEATKEKWHEAEVHRIAGEVALMAPRRDVSEAEVYFGRSLAVARKRQARSWELRTATSMARLWRDQGKRDQARDLLAPVYGWFTEGFDTLDLKEAKKLLDELVWPLSGDRD
jgi:predicted ATPase